MYGNRTDVLSLPFPPYSPIQPSWVPPNCKFTMDDAEKPWTYADNTFDFIHFRNVAQAISNWPAVMAEAYRCLKPGGYIEMADTNGTPRTGKSLYA